MTRPIRREAVARAARERSEQERERPRCGATGSHLFARPLMPSRDLRPRRRRRVPRIRPLPRLPQRAGRAARCRLRARPERRHRDRRSRLVRRRQCSIGDGSRQAAPPGPGGRRDGERSSHRHLTRRNHEITSRAYFWHPPARSADSPVRRHMGLAAGGSQLFAAISEVNRGTFPSVPERSFAFVGAS